MGAENLFDLAGMFILSHAQDLFECLGKLLAVPILGKAIQGADVSAERPEISGLFRGRDLECGAGAGRDW